MKNLKKVIATIVSIAIIISFVSLFTPTTAEASSANIVWELTYEVPWDVAVHSYSGAQSRFQLSNMTRYNGTQTLTNDWFEEFHIENGNSYGSMDQFPIRLFASFNTADGWIEFFVPFQPWQFTAGTAPEGVNGQLVGWDLRSDNVISIAGFNATGEPIRLRLVKYEGELEPIERQHQLVIRFRDQWFTRPELNLPTYNQRVRTGESVTLKANDFDVPGFRFLGWNTRADGTGTHYEDQATFIYNIDGNLTLYAQWEEIEEVIIEEPQPEVELNEEEDEFEKEKELTPEPEDEFNEEENNESTPEPEDIIENEDEDESTIPTPIPTPQPTPEPTPEVPDNNDDIKLPIIIPESTVIDESLLETIKQSGEVFEITLPNGLVILIDPNLITDNAKSIDLNIEFELTEDSIVINPAAHGEFGFTISFTISAEMLSSAGLTTDCFQLVHISNNEVVTDYGTILRNDDDSVTISISHASRWEVYNVVETPVDNTLPESTVPTQDPIVIENERIINRVIENTTIQAHTVEVPVQVIEVVETPVETLQAVEVIREVPAIEIISEAAERVIYVEPEVEAQVNIWLISFISFIVVFLLAGIIYLVTQRFSRNISL
jgi:hypothetical protein